MIKTFFFFLTQLVEIHYLIAEKFVKYISVDVAHLAFF